MGKITAFNFITLNGFYKGAQSDISWHRHGGEEAQYSVEGLRSENTLLFGRITYEMMAGYWPTAAALDSNPVVAEGHEQSRQDRFFKNPAKRQLEQHAPGTR